MGIEPTSEAWEACCRWLKTHKLAAFCRFSKFSIGFPLQQRKDDGRGKGDGQCCGYREFLQSYLELKNCRNQK